MKETSFKDFIAIQRGHDLPERKRVPGEIPVVGSNGIVGSHNTSKGLVPGLTIGRSGSIGNVNFLEKPYFPLNTTLYVTDFKGNDEKFVYYFLKNFDFSNFDSGSVQPSLNRNYIYTATVKYPDIEEQKVIAEFLDSFDRKIELNQQMNETLEEIAKTLFKSWFIDFDPVRAKAEGRPTGLSKEISDLFPDSFEDSELGEIPRGWKVGNLGNLCVPKRGKVITKAKVEPGNFPVVAGGIKPPYYHSESNAESPIVTISASGTAGFVNLYYQDIWASDCSYINKDITDNVFFIYSYLKINQQRIYDLRHGAVQQHVYPKI